jgi:hypothetical protein
MNKKTKTLLIVAVVAVAGYLAFRWYQNRKAQQGAAEQSPTGAFGTNLNSVAPELIGGSTGPSVGPVLSSPVSITLNETSAQTAPVEPGDEDTQMGVNDTDASNPMKRQRASAGQQGEQDRSPGVTEGVGSIPGKNPKTIKTPLRQQTDVIHPTTAKHKKAAPAKRTHTPMKAK